MLPTTLQMAMLRAPFFLASRSAASVSAVSPDWGDDDRQRVLPYDRLAIPVLGSVVDFDRDTRRAIRS